MKKGLIPFLHVPIAQPCLFIDRRGKPEAEGEPLIDDSHHLQVAADGKDFKGGARRDKECGNVEDADEKEGDVDGEKACCPKCRWLHPLGRQTWAVRGFYKDTKRDCKSHSGRPAISCPDAVVSLASLFRLSLVEMSDWQIDRFFRIMCRLKTLRFFRIL